MSPRPESPSTFATTAALCSMFRSTREMPRSSSRSPTVSRFSVAWARTRPTKPKEHLARMENNSFLRYLDDIILEREEAGTFTAEDRAEVEAQGFHWLFSP